MDGCRRERGNRMTGQTGTGFVGYRAGHAQGGIPVDTTRGIDLGKSLDVCITTAGNRMTDQTVVVMQSDHNTLSRDSVAISTGGPDNSEGGIVMTAVGRRPIAMAIKARDDIGSAAIEGNDVLDTGSSSNNISGPGRVVADLANIGISRGQIMPGENFGPST